jgi:hypothetical protein
MNDAEKARQLYAWIAGCIKQATQPSTSVTD